jgi:hypothetical protein
MRSGGGVSSRRLLTILLVTSQSVQSMALGNGSIYRINSFQALLKDLDCPLSFVWNRPAVSNKILEVNPESWKQRGKAISFGREGWRRHRTILSPLVSVHWELNFLTDKSLL